MTATEVRPDGVSSVAAATPPYAAGPTAVTAPPDRHFSLLHVGDLPRAVRESRHRMLIAILALHVPLVLLLGIDRHRGAATSAELMLPALVAVLGARFLTDRLLRSASVVVGLCWSSYAIVYLSGGSPEAHLHPLLVIVLVALYQDPALLAGAVVGLTAMLAVPSALEASLVYAPGDALRRPWAWTGVHVLAILGVAGASALSWRRDVPVPVFVDPTPVEADPEPEPDVAEHIERARSAELALARRQATYALMTNLARRNQSLVGRQLSTLDDLERDERDPDVLAGLFALDHLATRMRRNAENLLVLAGAGNNAGRSFSQPIPVDELLRGAAAEVEQYARVDVNVGAGVSVAGQAVSDVAHLLAELLDNALACSPPDTQVTVGAAPGADGALRLWVADEGIGMTAARLAEHNALLSDSGDELEVGATLGFPVVKRLAARHGIHVALGSREGGQPGLVAYVDLPADLVVTDGPVPGSSVVAPAAPAAIAGRRTARRVSEDIGRQRRNELALDAAAENWFHPAPLPDEVEEDVEATWGADDWWAPASDEAPAVPPVEPAVPLVEPIAGNLPTRGGPAPDALPQRPVSAPPTADAGRDEAHQSAMTAPLDVAALRATIAAQDVAVAPVTFVPAEPVTAEPVDVEPVDEVGEVVGDTTDVDATEVDTEHVDTADVDTAELEDADEPEVDELQAAPVPTPAGSAYDEILFGSAPPSVVDELPPIPGALDEVLPWASAETAHGFPPAGTVVPTPVAGRGGLARRIPQQALREAGGTPAPQTYEPGPVFGAAPGGDADPAERPAAPDPGHASDVLASYRAGMARARAARTSDPDTDTTPNGESA